MGGALLNGGSVEWWTPPHIFDALGLSFDLDVCGPVGGVEWIPAERTLSVVDNGLSSTWTGRVWMNPPYGRGMVDWAKRMRDHGDGVALVFARTDTVWFHEMVDGAGAICFIKKRLSFIGPSVTAHNAAAPSVLIGYGTACSAAVLACGLGLPLIPPMSSAIRS